MRRTQDRDNRSIPTELWRKDCTPYPTIRPWVPFCAFWWYCRQYGTLAALRFGK